MSIQILPANLRDQIAAGEVVERPASIIKELIENSLDAGATQINIIVKNGGKDLIEIEDNGTGMTKKDAELSVQRYATSKISTIEDLYNIHTFGFRGEALASIASVSNFTLQSRTANDLVGTQIKLKGGDQKSLTEMGTKIGTKVIIQDLFYNIPARLKFLKADTTENLYILKTIQNFACINPNVSFRYINNGKVVLDLLPEENSLQGIKKRLEKVFRKELISDLEKIELDLGYLKITGFASTQNQPQNNRNYQYTFVNQRNIEDRTIKAAINEVYQNLIPRGSYPAYFLFLEISPDLVDVNVHPRKTEVKFLNQQEVFQAVKKTFEKSFSNNLQQPNFTHSFSSHLSHYQTKKSESYLPKQNYNTINNRKEISLALDFSKNLLQPLQNRDFIEFQSEEEQKDWKIIGQIAQSYILIEKKDGIYFLDQHAADEKIKYEKIKSDYQNKKNFTQALLIPLKIEVSFVEKEIIEQNLEWLQKLGFELEHLGENTYLITSIPQEIAELEITQVFLDMLDELADELKNKIDFENLLEKSFKYFACRSAVMFGDKMEFVEMQRLVQTVFLHPEYQTCPHGRPFFWQIPFQELNKKFKR